MTNKTETFGIRLNTEDKAKIAQFITRKALESILGQIERGEIEITDEGVSIPVIERVNTTSENVNTYVNTEYDDPDGEWVRDIAHELNIDVRSFKRRIEQSIRR